MFIDLFKFLNKEIFNYMNNGIIHFEFKIRSIIINFLIIYPYVNFFLKKIIISLFFFIFQIPNNYLSKI